MKRYRYQKLFGYSILASIAFSLIVYSSSSLGVNTTTPYINSTYYTDIPFGYHSHWIQPWRAYLETIPAHQFINGIGAVFNINTEKTGINPDLVAEMLARHGVKQARLEINWNKIDYNDETKVNDDEGIRDRLLALQKQNMRPLILLNANQGAPCPMKTSRKTVAKNANVGDTAIRLEDTRGIKPNYSGLSNIGKKPWAAEILITEVNDNWVTLSKPLPEAIAFGSEMEITTLKYRPFSSPDSADYQNTIRGWQRYVGTVTEYVTEILGTTNSEDKGFDLEIWNELSFGSNFLYINEYYQNNPYKYKKRAIWLDIVAKTVEYVEDNPQKFQGVKISNGFSNTTPWPAASEMPPRIVALNKHPYRSRKFFPEQEYEGSKALDALGNKTQFTPSYSIWFPEYFATFLQTETLLRDLAPFPSEFGGAVHGRNARTEGGETIPMTSWITEVNIQPQEEDADVSDADALALKAKAAMRYYTFFLNKGAERVYLYNAGGGNKGYGIVRDNFLEYASGRNRNYPQPDGLYASPTLIYTSRIVRQMQEGLDSNLRNPRQLEVVSITEQHNNYQFEGDGSKAHPNLYNRELFTFLPYQVNQNKFVIPYYVMTRDIKKNLPPENYQISVKGFNSDNLQVKIYDPWNDRYFSEVSFEQKQDRVVIDLEATDYPYLLIVEE